MSVQEYVLDEPATEWADHSEGKRKELDGGPGGGPYANISLPAEGRVTPAHFHDVAQFQVCLGGTVTFPDHPLEPIGVYYTDAYMAYGPFVVGPNHVRGLFRPGKSGHSVKGGLVWMTDLEGRKARNPHGREFYGLSKDVEWEELTGEFAGLRRKNLFGRDEEGPSAQLLAYPASDSLRRDAARFGEYHVLVEGSARLEHGETKPRFMRFVVGDESPAPIASGPEGATWLILTFDQAAEPKSPTGAPVRPL